MALAVLTEVKELLKLAGSNKDAILQNLLNRGQEHIETLINRRLDNAVFTELYSGNAGRKLYLDRFPIRTINKFSTDVDHDNKTFAADILLSQVMIDKEFGFITLLSNSLFSGFRNIYVDYNAGFIDAEMPKDLKQVLLEMVVAKLQNFDEKRVGITSKNVMGENITFTFNDITPENMKIIDRQRKPAGKEGITATGFTLA